jgi:hypothetical protein
MAITFKVVNGDVSMNTSNGRPKTIGNDIDENDAGKAIEKTNQDLKRSLSLVGIRSGTTAGLQNLIGTVPQFGSSAIAVLVNRRIRSMFAAILREQSKRPDARPSSERFKNISTLRVFPVEGSKTSFRFRLGVRTTNRAITELSGIVG